MIRMLYLSLFTSFINNTVWLVKKKVFFVLCCFNLYKLFVKRHISGCWDRTKHMANFNKLPWSVSLTNIIIIAVFC